ncbi:DNA alkylation repair protein [Flavobacteriaceae bacterium S0825]|uniref:DNA alkylation repair protein n=1 Tax=Gaetbulibacter sp. S0825 TaxID=2720084 RepID=UPI00142FEAB4|nr:DNA alkylation repair protein [Gaetbulibacter sp. S0825]MCK0110017.1 DNA alkylation repair protein [Flavobacteriaceae bacterium S0825]NIX65646.1 DNA alkylation repair protein [Gaetbulibacter sp. S0825]
MFIKDLIDLYSKHANAENATHMKNYMRGQFEFYGIKTKERRTLLKQAIANNKEEVVTNVRELTFQLYDLPQRELHLTANEIFDKQLRKKYLKDDIVLIERLITENSWWDTVDFIAKWVLGNYLTMYPDMVKTTITRFSNVDNIWLNRSTIIFQLGYKHNTDEELLFKQCMAHKESNEFFIQKAIGWALREYGKTSPQSVLNFVNSTSLKPLSHREAIRNII